MNFHNDTYLNSVAEQSREGRERALGRKASNPHCSFNLLVLQLQTLSAIYIQQYNSKKGHQSIKRNFKIKRSLPKIFSLSVFRTPA